jgi:type II secretory pathway component PulC
LLKGAWVGVALVVLQACLLLFFFLRLPREIQDRDTPSPLTWRQPAAAAQSSSSWSVFQKLGSARAGISDPAKRFRLAGTFFVYQEGSADTRKAVLDDLRDKVQRIVKENDDLGGLSVIRILRDSVLLRSSDGQEEELVLGFSATAGAGQGTAGQPAGGQPSNRFGGSQVGDKSWIFSRSALLDYYQELKDEPQRLVAVFDSLKPQYNDKRRIIGYRLGIEGEREFFDATGLKEGDTVLKVNETPMTSQRQAERFISDFVNGKANAFVLDVDRGGTPQKLIYQTK